MLLITILGLSLFSTVFAYNWSYPLAAQQCSPFSVQVTNVGNDVSFPFRVLLVPVGPSPLTFEVRKPIEVIFSGNSTSVTFLLPYPTGSSFVGLVTDANDPYSGSASIRTVLSSDNATCFDPTRNAMSSFNFSLSPTDVAECRDVRIYWSPNSIEGVPSFIGIIPGDMFSPIPLGPIDTQPNLGTGFTWRPPVRAGTNLIFVGGDNRGSGSGGFISTFVSPGDPGRDSFGACPAEVATSSGVMPTSSAVSSPYSRSDPNVGIIVGCVGGGVALLALFIFILYRVLRKKPRAAEVTPYTQQREAVPPSPDYYGSKMSSPSVSSPSSDFYLPPRPLNILVTPQDTGGQLPMYTPYPQTPPTAITKVPL